MFIKYWWIIVTVPLLAMLFYYLGKKITVTISTKPKKMTGICIIGIIIGTVIVIDCIRRYPNIDYFHLIMWGATVILCIGRLIYDYLIKR